MVIWAEWAHDQVLRCQARPMIYWFVLISKNILFSKAVVSVQCVDKNHFIVWAEFGPFGHLYLFYFSDLVADLCWVVLWYGDLDWCLYLSVVLWWLYVLLSGWSVFVLFGFSFTYFWNLYPNMVKMP